MVDGSTIAIGSLFNDDNGAGSGKVVVYRIDSEGSSWESLVQSIHCDNAGDYVGTSVTLSSDGNILVIGSSGYREDDDRPGYVRVFSLESSLNTGSWVQIGQDIIGEANGDEFGYSVSLSDDGKTLAMGVRSADVNGYSSGHVKVYQMDDPYQAGCSSALTSMERRLMTIRELQCPCRRTATRWRSAPRMMTMGIILVM